MLKKIKKILIISLVICIVLLISFTSSSYLKHLRKEERNKIQQEVSKNTPDVMPDVNKYMLFEATEEGVSVYNEIVYDGMTLDELANKLDKSLNSTLAGKGKLFASKALEYEVNPYLIVAISLLETGCKWNCSKLVVNCNNVGGIKGKPSCNGGSFRKFDTLEEGIDYFVYNISKNYYDKGLITADLMAYKYSGGSTTWALKVNNYMDSIKAK